MDRKEEEKSALRKEGHVCGLDLFVKVPSGAAAPIKYKPMEIDRLMQRKRVAFDCSKPTF